MNFVPRMNNRIDGFSVVRYAHRRYWHGMRADLWDVDCSPEAGGYYVGSDPRIFVLLSAEGETGSRFDMTEIGSGGTLSGCDRQSVSFIPAGLELETQMRGFQHLRHLDLHFDRDSLSRRLGEDFNAQLLEQPRLMASEPRLIALAQLIAEECASANALHDLYGDGLTLALMLAVLRIQPSVHRRRGRLAGWQVRRVTEYIEENCLRTIRLDELAGLAGLSPTYFNQAFKSSTGLPPHQWQMRARIDRIKDMLLRNDRSLTEIAVDTGFADPAHFTRVFRRHVGVTPSQWRRSRL